MVMEGYFPVATAENDYNQNEIPQKCKPNKAIVDKDEGNSSQSIDCNICLDLVKDPVVTICGHLYCWPCIYKWIRFQSESSGKKTPHCPVCKAEISQETVIPLYVNGLSTEPSKGKKSLDIPQRPQSPRQDVYQRMVSTTPTGIGRPTQEAQPYVGGYTSSLGLGNYVGASPAFSNGGGGGGEGIIANHPGMGMFGEMVYARIFGGNTHTTVYAYPNSYNLVSTNPRIRRHLIEVDRSLSRLTFFLLCCMFLCLLLF